MVGCFYKYFPSLRGKYILLPLPWGKTHPPPILQFIKNENC